MAPSPTHSGTVSAHHSISALRRAAASCRACELWEPATQTVFGQGPAKASLMLVGEQPGDREDREGTPFVGPAGTLLNRALGEAGIPRDDVYVTNAVKHFRFQERGKRRIHQRPEARHIAACYPWVEDELSLVQPDVLVCLGAVAARSLLGSKVRVTKDRGHPLDGFDKLAPRVFVTLHPSAILRERDDESRDEAFAGFVADLRAAREPVAT